MDRALLVGRAMLEGRRERQPAGDRRADGGKGCREPLVDGEWIPVDDVELLLGNRKATPLGEVYEYEPGWGRLSDEDEAAITEIMSASAPRGRS